MERSTTAREALLAELIADVARLLERAEALRLAVDKSRDTLTDAAGLLDARVALLERHLAESLLRGKAAALQDLKRSTYEFAIASIQRQTESMTEAARQVVTEEFKLPLRQFAATLEARASLARRAWRPWLTHGVTAVATAAGTAMLIRAGGG